MNEGIKTTINGIYGYVATIVTITSAQEILGICVGGLTSIYLIIRIYKSLKKNNGKNKW